jgi:hypothetical protein
MWQYVGNIFFASLVSFLPRNEAKLLFLLVFIFFDGAIALYIVAVEADLIGTLLVRRSIICWNSATCWNSSIICTGITCCHS